MATAPIPGLLAELVVLGLQAVGQGAQLIHFRAQALHRGGQFRESGCPLTARKEMAARLSIHSCTV
jgi:hypothetical protein